MQLFAIIADVDDLNNKSRIVVEHFLKQRLSQDQVDAYLKHYDEYLEVHHKVSAKKEGKRKKTSLNSVKVLKICTQINGELEQRQKNLCTPSIDRIHQLREGSHRARA